MFENSKLSNISRQFLNESILVHYIFDICLLLDDSLKAVNNFVLMFENSK